MADSIIEVARRIVANHSAEEIDGLLLDAQTANAIVQVHDALNPTNQAKFAAMPLALMVDTAWKLIERSHG